MSRVRLVCPNCGAQYEVPVEVIPDGGRDVQCSNCGHTWYQRHPDDDPDLAEDLNEPVPDTDWEPDAEDDDWIEPDPVVDAPPVAQPVAQPVPPRIQRRSEAPQPQRDLDTGSDPLAETPKSRGLDPSVAEVLRQEAALETKRRAAEAQSLETQPDLGLTEPNEDEQARRAREARERMSRLRGENPNPGADAPDRTAAAEAAAAAGSRRDLLPDVEEINQTLRANSEPRAVDSAFGRVSVDEPAPPRGGFARGFFLIVLLAAAAIAVYAYAPQIQAQLPPVAPALDSYVAQVDQARLWLDGQVTMLLQSLDQMSSESQAAPTEAATTGN